MIQWNVRPLMDAEGIENGSQLAKFAGLTGPAAYRVLDPAPIERIETATLETLAKAFGLRSPWKLLLHTPDPAPKRGKRR